MLINEYNGLQRAVQQVSRNSSVCIYYAHSMRSGPHACVHAQGLSHVHICEQQHQQSVVRSIAAYMRGTAFSSSSSSSTNFAVGMSAH
jgi:hypothetical protein